MASSSRIHISNHPLVAHKMSILRDRATPSKQVRELIHELTQILLVEATQSLAIVDKGEVSINKQSYKQLLIIVIIIIIASRSIENIYIRWY
jgi:uracil phosphoribosyltransferase